MQEKYKILRKFGGKKGRKIEVDWLPEKRIPSLWSVNARSKQPRPCVGVAPESDPSRCSASPPRPTPTAAAPRTLAGPPSCWRSSPTGSARCLPLAFERSASPNLTFFRREIGILVAQQTQTNVDIRIIPEIRELTKAVSQFFHQIGH